MAMVKSVTQSIFDSSSVHAGDCIRAKKNIWDEFKNGVITKIDEDSATVVFYSGTASSTIFFNIYASEVQNGIWKILWTSDFENINTEGITND